MALSINDVISLANAGFTKSDIADFMNLGNPQTTPPSPVQVPGAAAPAALSNRLSFDEIAAAAAMATPPSPVQVPGAASPTVKTVPDMHKVDPLSTEMNEPPAPDYGQMMTALENLSKKVEMLSNPVPSAGTVGALPTVTSVEDIIMGAIKPAAAPAADVDFMKGVVK